MKLILFITLLLAVSPANAGIREDLQEELNTINARIPVIESRISQLETELQQAPDESIETEDYGDSEGGDDLDKLMKSFQDNNSQTYDGGDSQEDGVEDLDKLMVSFQDNDAEAYGDGNVPQRDKKYVNAFSDAKQTEQQQDEKGKFTPFSKDSGTKDGIDLDQLAKSLEAERVKSDQEKADTQKAKQADYEESIKQDMQKDAENWKIQMSRAQETVKRKMDEAKQLLADAREQGRSLLTDKELQAQLDKINSEYQEEKKKLDDLIRKKRNAETVALRRQENQQGDSSGDNLDTAAQVNRILNSAPEDLDQRTIECSTTSKSGGDKPAVVTVNMKDSFGTAVFTYDMYTVKDRMIVQYGGQSVLDTGCVSGSSKVPIQLSGESDEITVIVQPACEKKGTSWKFSLICPSSEQESNE